MRIAFISDIHGHGVALEAVLNDIETQQIDQIICLGDIATIGFQPRHVIARLRALQIPIIQGNHDAAILKPEAALQYKIAEPLMPTFQWCLNQLTEEDYVFFRSFPPALTVPLTKETAVYCYHGSPKSNTDSILATTPIKELKEYFCEIKAIIRIGGHTHVQMARQNGGIWYLNPGSVGNAFRTPYTPGVLPTLLPWAEYGILDSNATTLSFDCRRVYFDVAEARRTIEESGIPNAEWWLAQYSE